MLHFTILKENDAWDLSTHYNLYLVYKKKNYNDVSTESQPSKYFCKLLLCYLMQTIFMAR